MAWIEPKLNWQTGDPIHYTDYNRIRNNLLYVNDMLNEAFPDVAVTLNLGSAKTYNGNYSAKEFNRFNDAIASFARIGKDMSFGKARKYYDNAPFITADELNRMENCIYRYKNYDTPITSIQINQSKKHYDIFTYRDYDPETIQLSASVVPYDLSLGVSWTSSDPNVVTVDENGLVTRVGQGTATITATANGSDLSDTRTFSVYFGLESIEIIPNYLEMQFLDVEELAVIATPSFADYHVAWSSSDPEIVSVDDNGTCTAVGHGTATITATVTQDGFETVFTKSIQAGSIVHVDNVYILPNEADQVIWTKTSYSPETVQLSAYITPVQAGNKNVTWESSDTSVVRVDANGLVTRVGHGEATITCTTEDGGYVAIKNFIVNYGVNSISINSTSYSSTVVGSTKQLAIATTPTYATGYQITWSSSDTEIATVDSNGLVTMIGNGTATITGTVTEPHFNNATFTKTCSVSLSVTVTALTLSPTSLTIGIGKTVGIAFSITPSNAPLNNFTVVSSNASYIAVSSIDKTNKIIYVRGVASGSATITAKAGARTATATVMATNINSGSYFAHNGQNYYYDFIYLGNGIDATNVCTLIGRYNYSSFRGYWGNSNADETATYRSTINSYFTSNLSATLRASMLNVTKAVVTGYSVAGTLEADQFIPAMNELNASAGSGVTVTPTPLGNKTYSYLNTTARRLGDGVNGEAVDGILLRQFAVQDGAGKAYLDVGTEKVESTGSYNSKCLRPLIFLSKNIRLKNTANADGSWSIDWTGESTKLLSSLSAGAIVRDDSGTGRGSTAVKATAISVSSNSVSVQHGSAQSITVTATPSNASNATAYSVTSSNTSVVSVSKNGSRVTITGEKAGSATVTITLGGMTQTISVTVTPVYSTSISVSESPLGDIRSGTTKTFTISVSPRNSDYGWTYSLWGTSQKEVVEVGSNYVKVRYWIDGTTAKTGGFYAYTTVAPDSGNKNYSRTTFTVKY